MEVLDESSATTWRVVNVIKEVRTIIGQVFYPQIFSLLPFLHRDTYLFFRNAQKVDTQLMKP